MRQPEILRYAQQSRWSDPGCYASLLDSLPAEPARLPEIVGGLMLHPLFAHARSLPSPEPSLRACQDILAALLAKDDRPLDKGREPGRRVLGTCRSYALLACTILRHHGVPSRLRVGFADYFTPDFWEDHWVCEYHDDSTWRLLDAELSAEVCGRFGIAFDPADVPRDHFLTAGIAWSALRAGEHDPARFGVSVFGLAGLQFAAGSRLRDLAALGREEVMPWDYWGPARSFRPGVDIPPGWLGQLDSLATVLAFGRDGAAIIAAHPWAELTPTVLSFPEGTPVEVALDGR